MQMPYSSNAILYLRPVEMMERANFQGIKSIFYTFHHAPLFQCSAGIQDTTYSCDKGMRSYLHITWKVWVGPETLVEFLK